MLLQTFMYCVYQTTSRFCRTPVKIDSSFFGMLVDTNNGCDFAYHLSVSMSKHNACTTNSLLNNDTIRVVQGVSLPANQTPASTDVVNPQCFQKTSIVTSSEPH
jgi:hypothetical protein